MEFEHPSNQIGDGAFVAGEAAWPRALYAMGASAEMIVDIHGSVLPMAIMTSLIAFPLLTIFDE